MKISDLIIRLLGQKQESEDYSALRELIGEPTMVDSKLCLMLFKKAGVGLRWDTSDGVFWYANFRLRNMPVTINECEFSLPFGIQRSDRRTTLPEKLKGLPVASKSWVSPQHIEYWHDFYSCDPFLLCCSFFAASDELNSVTVMFVRLPEFGEHDRPFGEIVTLFLNWNEGIQFLHQRISEFRR